MILEFLGTYVYKGSLFTNDMYTFQFRGGDTDRFRTEGMEPLLPDNYNTGGQTLE